MTVTVESRIVQVIGNYVLKDPKKHFYMVIYRQLNTYFSTHNEIVIFMYTTIVNKKH